MQELIQHQVLSATSANITFNSIPSTWTDLVIKLSLRSDGSAIYSFDDLGLRINGDSGNNYIARVLRTREGSVSSFGGSASNHILIFGATASGATSSTFSSGDIHIPNYTAATAKSISHEGYTENNSSSMVQGGLVAGTWSGTAAVNSLSIFSVNGWNFVAGSSATLYGINRTSNLGRANYAPKATGGSIIYSNGFWYHVFTGSGSFVPQSSFNAEYLLVAGGGGGGSSDSFCSGAGGGGGGINAYSLAVTPQSYTVTVGGGGGSSGSGSPSSFGAQSLSGGGGGGSNGGGGGAPGLNAGGGAGGNCGGNGSNGGNGPSTFTSWAFPSMTGQTSGTLAYYSGGGGSGSTQGNGSSGGLGGGGGGGNGNPGTPGNGQPNTGGGGGGRGTPNFGNGGGSGGSGVVIVRYPAA